MELQIREMVPGCADGIYELYAPGCMAASLWWADGNGALKDWTALALAPVDPGDWRCSVRLTGRRAVPEGASHLLVRGFDHRGAIIETALVPLPDRGAEQTEGPLFRALVLSDLHTTRKPWTLVRALERGAGADCLLLPGDLTNDGTQAQFALLERILAEKAPDLPVFCVSGNHDLFEDGNFASFQAACLARTGGEAGPAGTFRAGVGPVEIFGLGAAAYWKDYMPVTQAQLDWLDGELARSRALWRIVLCHCPLRRDMPARSDPSASYIRGDGALQKVIDGHRRVLFLSGHTHLSPNVNTGLAAWDGERQNLYLSCGSIRPTELGRERAAAAKEWADGCAVELALTEDRVCINMYALQSKKRIARGCYVFPAAE